MPERKKSTVPAAKRKIDRQEKANPELFKQAHAPVDETQLDPAARKRLAAIRATIKKPGS